MECTDYMTMVQKPGRKGGIRGSRYFTHRDSSIESKVSSAFPKKPKTRFWPESLSSESSKLRIYSKTVKSKEPDGSLTPTSKRVSSTKA